MPKPVDKESRGSAGPYQQHQLQREIQQADVPNKLLDDSGNNDPDLSLNLQQLTVVKFSVFPSIQMSL